MTTPKQQQRVSALPAGKVSTVGYKGKLYYVYPTATKDRILVGNQTQYNAYKQALVAYGVTTSPDFVEETHGPHRILIQQFEGSVLSASDPEIPEKHRVVGSLLAVSGLSSVICNR